MFNSKRISFSSLGVITVIFGIPDVFIDHGDTEVLMTRSGLDPAHIRAKIEAALS